MWIYVLDYSTADCSVIELDNQQDELEGDELLDALGFNPSDCSYLISDNLNINFKSKSNE